MRQSIVGLLALGWFSTFAWSAGSWVGNFSYYSERNPQTLCAPEKAVKQIEYSSWDRQRAMISNLCFEVYASGVTDQEVASPGQLDVHVFAPNKFPARYIAKRGNNFLYAVSIKDLDPLVHGVSASGNKATSLELTVSTRPVFGRNASAESEPLRVIFTK